MARGLSLIAGVACAFAAWWMLSSGNIGAWIEWPLDQQLMPVIIAVTVLTGHLTGSALRSFRFGHAVGFALVTCLGLSLTILSSVVRQTDSRETRRLNIDDANQQKIRAINAVSSAQRSVDDARTAVTTCSSRDDRCLDGARQKLIISEKSLFAAQNHLNSLGSRVVSTTVGQAAGRVVAALGGRSDIAERWIDTLWAYGWSLFFEVGSIVALGFGLSNGRIKVGQRWPTSSPNVVPAKPDQPDLLVVHPVEQSLVNVGQPTIEQSLEIIESPTWNNVDPLPLLPALAKLADNGEIYTNQETLAQQLSLSSRKKVRALLLQLEAGGHIQLNVDRSGTRIKIL